ncbi:MAG: hypothetical protein QNK11_00775 [Legionella sp.]|nr:hypothetical protein [Legionella sp.]
MPDTLEAIEREAAAFMPERIAAVKDVLNYSKYAFLAGQTGVGKSTFVRDHWEDAFNNKPGTVFIGMDRMKDWLLCKTPGPKTLFIDELNLIESDFSLLEGLFLPTPAVYLDNQCYELDSDHYFLGAGNAVNDGGERTLASLLERHGKTCMIKPLSSAFLYCNVLRPLFDDSEFDTHDLFVKILDFYVWVLALPSDSVLMTPREIASIAFFIRSYLEAYPDANTNEVTYFYAYQVAKSVVPEAQQALFNQRFIAPQFSPETKVVSADSTYVWTESRLPMKQQLDAFLRTRAFKQNTKTIDFRKNTGLSVCLFEGVSGIGKSELTEDYLKNAWGFKLLDETNIMENNTYQVMPTSLSMKEKQTFLSDAYHHGRVVIVDEVNSISLGEAFMNGLFNQKPNKNGFMIIATQNAASKSAGRRLATNPEARRALKLELPAYTEKELCEIAEAKEPNLPKPLAKKVARAFHGCAIRARQSGHTKVPTMRQFRTGLKRVGQFNQSAQSIQTGARSQGFFSAPRATQAYENTAKSTGANASTKTNINVPIKNIPKGSFNWLGLAIAMVGLAAAVAVGLALIGIVSFKTMLAVLAGCALIFAGLAITYACSSENKTPAPAM